MSRRGLGARALGGVALPQQRLRPRAVGAETLLPDTINSAASTIASDVSAVASATPHVKGAWAEVVASVSADVGAVLVQLGATSASTTDTSTLLDIGVGGAGSEIVVVANYPAGYRNSPVAGTVPLFIPAGSRVAVRCQSVTGSKSVPVRLAFFAANTSAPRPAAGTVTVGADTSTSRGTVINYPGTTNTKSAWVELTSAVDQSLSAVYLGVQGASDVNWSGAFLLDIGVGGAASEVVVVGDVPFEANTLESANAFLAVAYGPWAVNIPAGARIAARAAMSSSNIGGIDVALIGIPWRP